MNYFLRTTRLPLLDIRNLCPRLLNLNSNSVHLTAANEFALTQSQPNSVSATVGDAQHVKDVYNLVNSKIEDPRQSRNFAVVMVGGSQYKVTTEDVIVVRNHFYPTIGDKIRLEKVLLVGSKDFTVVGKPVLSKSFVRVEATVVEKTLANNVVIFKYKPRKDNRKMNFHKGILTLLRINSIDIIGPVPEA